jgi:hypothetical protein
MTLVVPVGKNDPDGGVQTTVPQLLPDELAEKVTVAPHCPAVFVVVMSAGQVTSQVCGVVGGIVTDAVNVLSVANNSFVSLVTVAVAETTAPPCAAESIW